MKITSETAQAVADALGLLVVEEIDPIDGTKTPGINVPTHRGMDRASAVDGAYIIAEFDGLNVFWPDWFEKNYTKA